MNEFDGSRADFPPIGPPGATCFERPPARPFWVWEAAPHW